VSNEVRFAERLDGNEISLLIVENHSSSLSASRKLPDSHIEPKPSRLLDLKA
jgi:hypothetical protein